MMNMIPKISLLVILLLAAYGKDVLAQPQDNSTIAPNVDATDALLDGPGPDGDAPLPYGCEPAFTALDKCDKQYNCSTTCPEAFAIQEDPSTEMGDPFENVTDPTNTTGITDALQTGFDALCADYKKQICIAKECCLECTDELEAALQCNVEEGILFLNETLTKWLSDVLGGVGEWVDAGLGIVNDLAGAALNTTIAPTGFQQAGYAAFADAFSSLQCNIQDNACAITPGEETSVPAEASSPGETTTPGETPSPGVTPTPGATPAPGSTTAPGSAPSAARAWSTNHFATVMGAAAIMLIM